MVLRGFRRTYLNITTIWYWEVSGEPTWIPGEYKKIHGNVFFLQIFKSANVYMKDAECAERNEKLIFRFMRFLVFGKWSFLYSKLINFSMDFECNIDYKSKNKSRKNGKLIFRFSQLIAHLFCKFDHSWTTFFFGWWHTWKSHSVTGKF